MAQQKGIEAFFQIKYEVILICHDLKTSFYIPCWVIIDQSRPLISILVMLKYLYFPYAVAIILFLSLNRRNDTILTTTFW